MAAARDPASSCSSDVGYADLQWPDRRANSDHPEYTSSGCSRLPPLGLEYRALLSKCHVGVPDRRALRPLIWLLRARRPTRATPRPSEHLRGRGSLWLAVASARGYNTWL